MKLKFPKEFLWGGAAAAEQIEGHGKIAKGLTIWDQLYKENPGIFYQNIGPETTNDFTNKYKEDIKMFAKMKINSIRLGFSWARIYPDGKTLNQEAVSYYHSVLNELKKHKIKAIMCIFHFDMPQWAQEIGGFESFQVVEKFVTYGEFLFREFGDKVYMYATMNEPNIPVLIGYLGGKFPPLVNDSQRAVQAGFGTILAHAKLVNVFNAKFMHLKAKIGVIIAISPGYPKDNLNFNDNDKKAAKDFNAIFNLAMLDPMINGEFPPRLIKILENKKLLPKYEASILEEIKKVKVDYLGVNFYAPARLQAPKNPHSKNLMTSVANRYEWKKARINVFRGWEIYPEAIRDIAKLIKDRYKNMPFFISENGIGVQDEAKYRNSQSSEINDNYRIAFIKEHLEQVHKANADGANCFGYHLWAITDNWSWVNAYKNRYGFIEVNIKTQARKFKKSARWFKTVIENNGFDNNYQKVDEIIDFQTIDFVESENHTM